MHPTFGVFWEIMKHDFWTDGGQGYRRTPELTMLKFAVNSVTVMKNPCNSSTLGPSTMRMGEP